MAIEFDEKNKPTAEDIVRSTVEVKPQDLQPTQQIPEQPIEITEDEDGGATIDFDPQALVGQGTASHEENLAEFL